MKLAGVVNFYDESPSWLSASVSSLGRFCDLVLIHDGAYALYPSARPRSHPQQAEAAIIAAEAADIACLVYRPRDIYYGNEVEKRNEGLRIAGSLLEPDTDWLIVWDADFHLQRCNPTALRASLAASPHDVATYTLLDSTDMLANPTTARLARQQLVDIEWATSTRDIYRWTPTLEIGPTHWSYSRVDAGVKRWLRGPGRKPEDALDLGSNLVAYHRKNARAKVRRNAAERYYHVREAHGIEAA